MKNNQQCRVCGSNHTEDLGRLPLQTHFAGKLLNYPFPESRLYKCNSCLMLARYPILSVTEYNALYAQASSDLWSSSNTNLRPDQAIAKNIVVNRFKNGCNVLDVGCYTGALLSSLPSQYIKYGIEMSKEAANASAKLGINIIGADLYNISTELKFDLIIAIDVIEHTQNPAEFLKKLSSMLSDDGEIIISTGNSDCWLWKKLKNNFWYSQFYEHISFIGVAWLKKFCMDNNFEVTNIFTFNYNRISIKLIIKSFLTLMNIYPEKYSYVTKDHFCFSIKVKKSY